MAATELLVLQPEPLCAESPLELQEDIVTPLSRFYVRSNFSVPALPTQVSIGGAVSRPLTLTPNDLGRLPRRRLSATLECAGNGRSFMNPPVPGEQWRLGAVSTAEWEGVALSSVLSPAGVAADVIEILFTSADGFARSLPTDQARSDDTLVVDTMNGEPLSAEHGAPLRLLVPGWYGMASVKWLVRIEALRFPFRGHFQVERYVIGDRPVRQMQPRSLIIEPRDGARVSRGRQVIRGLAWTGSGHITSVQVSDDGGNAWLAARLLGEQRPYTWRQWECDWFPSRSGHAALISRATDSHGSVQPIEPVWNALGYANNATVPTQVTVETTVRTPIR